MTAIRVKRHSTTEKLRYIHSAADAAGKNEELTRQRVENLERAMIERVYPALASYERHEMRTFWGRLSWLLSGK